MRYWYSQFNVTHPFTPHLGMRNFDAAAVANYSPVPDALISTAVAFPVLYRTKNTLAKQSITFRLIGAVIDCFRLCSLTA